MSVTRPISAPWAAFKGLRSTSCSKTACVRARFHASSRLCENVDHNEEKISLQDAITADVLHIAQQRNIPIPPRLRNRENEDFTDPRLPRNVQALYFAPLKRTAEHGIPVCNLQLRSFSVRNLELMADFALRAAYYLNLPASGPVPLPRRVQRWTVPRSNFVNKKSQENFERVTLRRLIQIQDGHPEVVQRWLAFIRKWSWHGVGMKADVWEHEGLDVTKKLEDSEDAIKQGLKSPTWSLFGRRSGLSSDNDLLKLLENRGFPNPQKVDYPRRAKSQEKTETKAAQPPAPASDSAPAPAPALAPASAQKSKPTKQSRPDKSKAASATPPRTKPTTPKDKS